MSQITTHVLDTSKGQPAEGLPIELYHQNNNQWHSLGKGKTNSDGRISDLLADDQILIAGVYKMTFNTADYFSTNKEKAFYPTVDIIFELQGDGSHYHIPLLLSAYGYTTYRGS